MPKFMKYLPYVLISILAFGLGWFTRLTPSRSNWKSDTVIITNTVRRVDVDTQYILFPVSCLAWVDKTDTIHVSDTCYHLREYKEYSDSNYYAKISGVEPRLDEIRVFPKTITEYVYQDRIVRGKQKRWGLGLSVGYGMSKSGLSPVVAVTVNYNLFNWE